MSYILPLKSEMRLRILLNLLKSEKKSAELAKEIQTRETTILHTLKELGQAELTTKSNGTYKLTSLGIIEAQICKMTHLSCTVLEKHKEFWLTHDVSGIPPTLMLNIGSISNAVLITDTNVDLQKVHEDYLQLLNGSKTVFGISPIFHKDYMVAYTDILLRGNNVNLIVTSKVLEKIIHTNGREQINKYVCEGSLQIYLNDDLKLGLTVTEQCLSLGLFNLSGTYDYTNDLVCNGKEALEWGHQLFQIILEKSTKM